MVWGLSLGVILPETPGKGQLQRVLLAATLLADKARLAQKLGHLQLEYM